MKKHYLSIIFLSLGLTIGLSSCGNKQKAESDVDTVARNLDSAKYQQSLQSDVDNSISNAPAVKESHISHVKMHRYKDKTKASSQSLSDTSGLIDYSSMSIIRHSDFKKAMEDSGYVSSTPDSVYLKESGMVLSDEYIVTAYSKKGDPKGAFMVVTNPANPEDIQEILVTHHKAVDVYNVSNGMTAKEARKLRKDLKHVEHKGTYFLVDETSNIMYQLDATDAANGKTYTTEELDELKISSIVWKDKKRKKM